MSDRFRGQRPHEIRAELARIDNRLRELHADHDGQLRMLSSEEQAEFDRLIADRDAGRDRLASHQRADAGFRSGSTERAFGHAPAGEVGQVDANEAMRLSDGQAREAGLRLLESRSRGLAAMDGDHVDQLLRRKLSEDSASFDGALFGRRLLVTESDAYRSAFRQLISEANPILTSEEAAAIRAFRALDRAESRAMSENVGAAGGVGVPTLLDPSIMPTAQGALNPFRQAARWVQVNTNVWKGVTSAGMTWSFDTEATAVSDDSPTLGQPSVTVHMARGWIPYSVEVSQDYPAFADEMAAILADGYEDLLLSKLSTGSGTSEPKGIITALDATAASEVLLTTAGSFGEVDLYGAWKALPQRFRQGASWMMSVGVNNHVRRMGAVDVSHAFTASLPTAWVDVLFGRAVYENSYFPDVVSTTGHSNQVVLGDFKSFLVAERAGLNIELIPHLFDVTTLRPTGQRGLFAWARAGSDVVTPTGLRLINQT